MVYLKKRKDGQDISFDDITDKLDDLEMAINELSDRVEDKGDELTLNSMKSLICCEKFSIS